MNDDLTQFQLATTQAIRVMLAERKRNIESEELSGSRQKYVILSVAGHQVYVYEDGAEILGNGLDMRFEREDYPSLEHLQRDMLSQLSGLL